MRPLTKAVGIAALILVPIAGMAASQTETNSNATQQWHQGILAGYQSLAAEAGDLSVAAVDYCSAPEQAARDTLEQAWLDTFLAWQRVRFVDFGPVENDNLAWQFQFWPDPKNLIARKASYLLNSEDPISGEVIAESGVAVQGFPMLEYLLYDEPLNASDNALPAEKTCGLLRAVAGHIETNSQQLSDQWQAFREDYLATEQYRDTTIRAGMAALEILEDRRLAQPMGLRGNGKRSVYAADAWRSGRSLKTIEATIHGLEQSFLPGLTQLLKESEQPQLGPRIENQFKDVLEHFPELHRPMTELLSNDDAFSLLQGFYVDVSQLTTLINDQAAVELGVIRGFNSSDGD